MQGGIVFVEPQVEHIEFKFGRFFPEPPGVSPGRGSPTPHGCLHPGKCEHSEVQSSSMIAGASLWFMGGPPH